MWPLSIDETIKLIMFPATILIGRALYTSRGAVLEKAVRRVSGTPGSFWNFFMTSNARLSHALTPNLHAWMLKVQRVAFTSIGIALMIISSIGLAGVLVRSVRLFLTRQ